MAEVEPWPGYPPEMNAGRYAAGPGQSTWLAAQATYMQLGVVVAEAAALILAQITAAGASFKGATAAKMMTSVGPFMAWLSTMEGIAAKQAAAYGVVAGAYSAGQTSMIPTPAVNANRVAEAVAEQTNFLGINSAQIAALNAQYAQMWTQNAATMVTYDEAVTIATIPIVPPPAPPIGNPAAAGADAAQAAATVGMNAAQAGSQAGAKAGTQASTQATQQSATGAGQTTGMGGDMMSQLGTFASTVPQLATMPFQFGGQLMQLPQTMLQPLQQFASPMMGMMGQFQNGTGGVGAESGVGQALRTGGPSAALAGLGQGGVGGAGGGGVGLGGGLGTGLSGYGAGLGTYGGAQSTAAGAKSAGLFGGVPKEIIAAGQGPAAGPAGGGAPMGPMSGRGTGTAARETIVEAQNRDEQERAERKRERQTQARKLLQESA